MKRFSFVIEIACLYALIALVGYVMNDGAWSFPGMALHPFLLVIAFEASQYGLRPGMLASAVGLVLYLIGAGSPGSEDSLPILAIVVTGILLGMLQEARSRKLRETRSELDKVRNEQERFRQRIHVLTEANNELNERILGEVNTVNSFSEIARRLSVLDRQDLYPAICELVNDYISASRSTVYSLVGNQLELKAAKGFVVVPEELKQITDPTNLAMLVIKEKTTMSALDMMRNSGSKAGLTEGQHAILMAAPILNEETGQITGVVCVNNMPFSRFHDASKKILGVVARWAGDSLHNAELFEKLRAKAGQKG